jgi:predicted MFS family arabinose efflux permease
MSTRPQTALEEWKQHWLLAAVSLVGFTYSPVATYSLGLFMEPLQREFGWERSEISMGLFVNALFAVLFTAPVGALIDRYGARRNAIPGIMMGMVALGALSFANGSLVQWVALWTFYAMATLFIKTTVWCAAVSKAFSASRGLAIGVVLCGSGLSQSLTPIIAQRLIDGFGWRHAYQFLALGWGGLVLILLVLFFHDFGPNNVPKKPKSGHADAAPATALPGYTFREAIRTRPIIRICAAVLIGSIVSVGIAVHLVPILVDVGLSRSAAAGIGGLAGLSAIAGKLLTGALLDRVRGSLVPFLSFSLPSAGMALLLVPQPGVWLAGLAVMVLGFAAGSVTQSQAYLITRYAGLRSYGAVLGVASSIIGLTLGFAPWFAGKVFDVTGSYQLVLMLGIPCTLAAGAMVIALGAYPEFEREPAS